MAEAYVRGSLQRMGVASVQAASAGFFCNGEPASAAAQAVMAKEGCSLKNFRSSVLTRERVREAERVVCMTRSHRNAVLALAPDCAERVGCLLPDGDVPDPYGGDEASYRRVFEFMRPALDALARELADGETGKQTVNSPKNNQEESV